MLVGNRSVLLKSPGRFLSGTIASIERSNFSKPGMMANRFQSMSMLSGIPSGHLSPSAWFLPRTAGGMSSHNYTSVSMSVTGAGAEGVNGSGSTSVALSATAIGQLVASAIGTTSLSLSATGSAFAALNGSGEATFTLTTSGTANGLGFAVGTASMQVTGTMVSYAIGHMSGTTEDVTGVTPTSVASAVWARAIEAGYTAEQILRIIAAHAAGAATGLEGANPVFVGIDGTTTRIDGGYSAGTRTINALDGD